jgi:hypothetical protein
MNEQETALFKATLETLQDIASYLEKSDDISKEVAIQERAKIDVPPKAQEYQDEIEGGAAAGNKPAEGIAKEYIAIPENPKKTSQKAIDAKGSTMIKAEDEECSESSESSEEASEDKGEVPEMSSDTEELKSLLKDIRDALSKSTDVDEKIEANVKKSMDKMMRKMGFAPTRPDVSRIESTGLDLNAEVAKSEDAVVKTDISKSEDSKIADIQKGVQDLSKKSWQELANLREKAGLFRAF